MSSSGGFWGLLRGWFSSSAQPSRASWPPFPDPETADAEGLVCVGGPLLPGRVLEGYRCGIFPWFNEGMPPLWWSPDPRGIIELDALHVSRRLARSLKKFELRFDTAFPEVMEGCADREEGTWITPGMMEAYGHLHRQGWAHSAEAWREGKLVGGVYGVAIGGLFAGESMFHRENDASKAALAGLVGRLKERGYVLFDIQLATDHTRSLGATEISRREYLRRLKEALRVEASFGS